MASTKRKLFRTPNKYSPSTPVSPIARGIGNKGRIRQKKTNVRKHPKERKRQNNHPKGVNKLTRLGGNVRKKRVSYKTKTRQPSQSSFSDEYSSANPDSLIARNFKRLQQLAGVGSAIDPSKDKQQLLSYLYSNNNSEVDTSNIDTSTISTINNISKDSQLSFMSPESGNDRVESPQQRQSHHQRSSQKSYEKRSNTGLRTVEKSLRGESIFV